MCSVEWYSNSQVMPVSQPLPFEPEQNYYRAIAQCVNYAGNEPTYMRSHMAIIPVDEEKRLVVTA